MINYILFFICKLGDFLLYPFSGEKVPVIFYHSISNRKTRIAVTSREFSRQMSYLHKKKYTSILPDELLVNKHKGKKIMICFDDGFRDNLTNAFPILDKFNFVATIFISAKYIGGASRYVSDNNEAEMLSEEEIRYLAAKGWQIGNHFYTHRNLIDLPDEEIQDEYAKTKNILEKILNKKSVDIASYPRSKVDCRVKEVVKKQGAKMAFAGERKMFSVKSDIFMVPRIEIDADVTFIKFKLYLSPSYFLLKKFLNRS